MDTKKIENQIKWATWLAIAFIIVIPAVYVVWFYGVNEFQVSTDSAIWGTFGDFVGGILNPLIAILAFYWLTQSVLIQKTELSETQKVLKETEKAQREQAITQEKKRFEDTFFSLLSQLNAVFDGLNTITTSHTPVGGTRTVPSTIKRLHSAVIFIDTSINTKKLIMKKHSADMGHYFRVIYHLLKFILQNSQQFGKTLTFDVAIQNKLTATEKFYSNIIRSFLNTEIVQLLAINCLANDTEDDFYKYRLLIERYSMLEHLYIDSESMIEIYDEYNATAFGTNPNFLAYQQAKND